MVIEEKWTGEGGGVSSTACAGGNDGKCSNDGDDMGPMGNLSNSAWFSKAFSVFYVLISQLLD